MTGSTGGTFGFGCGGGAVGNDGLCTQPRPVQVRLSTSKKVMRETMVILEWPIVTKRRKSPLAFVCKLRGLPSLPGHEFLGNYRTGCLSHRRFDWGSCNDSSGNDDLFSADVPASRRLPG